MRKLIWFTTIFVFFLLFILPFAASLLIKMIPDNDQPPYDINNKRGIYQIFEVSQSFTSQSDNLMAIGISLGNPNLKNKSEIIFDLKDTSGNMVRQVKINGANVQDGGFIKFNFDPIGDSKGKVYVFSLSSPAAGPEEILNIFFSTKKTSWIGPATYGKEIVDNGLPIVVYHKVPSHLQVAKDIFTSWVKRIL